MELRIRFKETDVTTKVGQLKTSGFIDCRPFVGLYLGINSGQGNIKALAMPGASSTCASSTSTSCCKL
jgi:hypothetical protein